MNASHPLLRVAPALLALALLVVPLTARAEDPAPERKLSKAKEKYDADKDGKLSDEEKIAAKEGAREKAKQTREDHKKLALEKYDANGNGKLDDDEQARMKADETAAREARKEQREEKKAGRAARKAAGDDNAK